MEVQRINEVKIGCTLNFSLSIIPGVTSGRMTELSHALRLQLLTGYFLYSKKINRFCQDFKGFIPTPKFWCGDLLFVRFIL